MGRPWRVEVEATEIYVDRDFEVVSIPAPQARFLTPAIFEFEPSATASMIGLTW